MTHETPKKEALLSRSSQAHSHGKVIEMGGGDASPFDNSTEDVSGAHSRGAMGPDPLET